MTSHSSSGLGIYLVAHRRFRPKPPADGILKYKKKKKEKKIPPQTPTTYPRQNGSGRAPAFASILSPRYRMFRAALTSRFPHGPAVGTGLEPPAAKGGRTAHPSHALGTYLGSAKLVNRDDGHPGEP